MTDTENVFDGFALLGDDEEFDVDKIFGGGSDEPAPRLLPRQRWQKKSSLSLSRNRFRRRRQNHSPSRNILSLQRRRKYRQKKNSLWDSFRRLQMQKATPSQRQPRSKALRQDPKHNCRSLTSRPFFSTAAPESRSQILT